MEILSKLKKAKILNTRQAYKLRNNAKTERQLIVEGEMKFINWYHDYDNLSFEEKLHELNELLGEGIKLETGNPIYVWGFKNDDYSIMIHYSKEGLSIKTESSKEKFDFKVLN